MDMFNGYSFERESVGYKLILYLNKNNTEFGANVDSSIDNKNLKSIVDDYIKNSFEAINITSVSLMLGNMKIASFPYGVAGFSYYNNNQVGDTSIYPYVSH